MPEGKTLKNINFKAAYSSEDTNILDDFYIPTLSLAREYYRITGFFSSDSFAVAAEGISNLIQNNGKVKLITGNVHLVINARAFKKLIEGAVNLKGTEKALLMVKPEGIEIRQMNSSSIAMVVARIPKAQFASYKLGVYYKVHIARITYSIFRF